MVLLVIPMSVSMMNILTYVKEVIEKSKLNSKKS